ncbi:MAG TPA: DUF192 domain-containing protein [Candidatus Paceibacterota bacterium]|nr:DUF192 domain-containing protein [Candidatus Paceibacterota bacterium]
MHSHTPYARAIAVVTIFLACAIGFGFLMTFLAAQVTPGLENRDGLTRITVGSTAVYVRVATTSAEWARGLSGTLPLPADQGMLFEFDHDDFWHIWMKDMTYPLDILWLADDGAIIHIAAGVAPDTYPQQFTSEQPARMVLELPAGFVEKHGVAAGQFVTVF